MNHCQPPADCCVAGALAAHVALRTELELGGLIVLSGYCCSGSVGLLNVSDYRWIPQMSSYPSALSKHRPDVLWCHADEDATILFGFATVCKRIEAVGGVEGRGAADVCQSAAVVVSPYRSGADSRGALNQQGGIVARGSLDAGIYLGSQR